MLAGWTHLAGHPSTTRKTPAVNIHTGKGVEWRCGKGHAVAMVSICWLGKLDVLYRLLLAQLLCSHSLRLSICFPRKQQCCFLVMYHLRSRIVCWSSCAPEVFSSEGSCASDGRSDGDKNISDFRTCRDYVVLFNVNCP